MTACFFQFFRPADIIFFIKTGFQFNEDSHLLAVFGCLDESRYNRRIAADTVKRLFNCQYIFILCRLIDEFNDGFKTFIRVMYHSVFFTNRLKNIIIAEKVSRRIDGDNRLEFQFRWCIDTGKFR